MIDLRPIDILMVDDNVGDVLLVKEHFETASISNHLHVLEDGEEALAYLQQQGGHIHAPRPDLILLDLTLPRREGLDVLRLIKSDAALKTIPVIVLTSSMDDADITAAYQANANCFVRKPIAYPEIIQVLGAIEHIWLQVATLPQTSAP